MGTLNETIGTSTVAGRLSQNARALLDTLLVHDRPDNDDGWLVVSGPPQAELRRASGLTQSNYCRAIGELKRLGILTVFRQIGHPYTFVVWTPAETDTADVEGFLFPA